MAMTRTNDWKAPAKHAIRYQKKRLWRDITNNVYTGVPKPDHDAAWSHLVERKLSPVGPDRQLTRYGSNHDQNLTG